MTWAIFLHVRVLPTPIKSLSPCTLFRSPGPLPRGSKVARKNRSSRGPGDEAKLMHHQISLSPHSHVSRLHGHVDHLPSILIRIGLLLCSKIIF